MLDSFIIKFPSINYHKDSLRDFLLVMCIQTLVLQIRK